MPGQDDDNMEDNIFDEGGFEDDGTADVIRNALAKAGLGEDGEDDDGGFDQPLEEHASDGPDVVSPDEGRDLLDQADIKKAKGQKTDDTTPKPDAAKAPDDTDTPDDTPEDKPADGKDGTPDQSDLSASDIGELLQGVPDDRRGEIAKRLSAAEQALLPFQTPYAQEQMKRFGANPQQVAERLVGLAEYAASKPDEYLAWVAKETAGDDAAIAELLGKAAARFGLKVSKASEDEDDDDLLADPEVQRIKRENAELRRKLQGDAPEFGPDAPAVRQQREVQSQITAFIAERDENGQLKRPHFNTLQPRIAQLAQAKRQQTGQPITTQDLDTLYETALTEARATFGGAGGSAAQNANPVADTEKKAAAAQRAKLASKGIDGTGQGATRRPALSEGASLDETLRHFAGLTDKA